MKHVLRSAAIEIQMLRRQNEILSAKVEMIDLFATVLHSKVAQRSSGGMAPDVVWELQQEIDKIEASEAKP